GCRLRARRLLSRNDRHSVPPVRADHRLLNFYLRLQRTYSYALTLGAPAGSRARRKELVLQARRPRPGRGYQWLRSRSPRFLAFRSRRSNPVCRRPWPRLLRLPARTSSLCPQRRSGISSSRHPGSPRSLDDDLKISLIFVGDKGLRYVPVDEDQG